MHALSWFCMKCGAANNAEENPLLCRDPQKCTAETHAAWLECPACGWETRVVRMRSGVVHHTNRRISESGLVGHA